MESSLHCQNLNLEKRESRQSFRDIGIETWNNPGKTTRTCFERYGSGRNFKKIQNTMLERYGVKSYLETAEINEMRNSSEIQEKIQVSKRSHGTFNSSKIEESVYEILKSKFNEVFKQYKSDVYPFNCDFYVKDIDLYIECNFHWTHGFHKFDIKKDEETLKKWLEKAKTSKFYKNAINTWTVRDVDKRQTALKSRTEFQSVLFFKRVQGLD